MDEISQSEIEQLKNVLIIEMNRHLDEFSTDKIRKTKSFSAATKDFKQLLCQLGTALGYQVSSHGNGREWLYDAVWYEADGTKLKRLVLALESENRPGGKLPDVAEVDRDFWKLVQSRATIRVWKTLIPNPDLFNKHIENCKRQVEAYVHSEPGDFYLFISSVWDGSVHIEGWEYAPPKPS